MNKVKKGQTKELQCRKELENDGWKIVFKSVRWRFGTIDFGSLFDVVAIKNKKWKFISVKNYSNFKNLPKLQEEIKKFKFVYGLEGMSFELWLWSKARWIGKGKNKRWQNAKWVKFTF